MRTAWRQVVVLLLLCFGSCLNSAWASSSTTTSPSLNRSVCISASARYEVSSIYDRYTPKDSLLTAAEDLYPAVLAGSNDAAPEFAFHTQLQNQPFIIVDLGRVCEVDKLLIENRRRQEQDRAREMSVWTSIDKVDWHLIAAFDEAKPFWELTPPAQTRARFCKLGLRGSNYFHLAHVRVLGRDVDGGAVTADNARPQKSVIVSPGEQAQIFDCGEGMKVCLPAGLLKAPAELRVSNVQNPPPNQIKALTSLKQIDVSLGNLHILDKDIELVFPYSPNAARPGVPAWATIFASYYDSDLKQWCALPCKADVDAKTIRVRTRHLSIISISKVQSSYAIACEEGPLAFGVIYNRDTVIDNTISFDNPAFNPIKEPEVPRYIKAVLGAAGNAVRAYTKVGLLPANKIMLIFVEGNGNPVHNGITGRIIFPLNVTSTVELRRELAHEIFHNVERSYYTIPGMLGRKWWAESCAEYAASRIAVPEYGMRMGVRDTAMPPNYLDMPLSLVGSASDRLTANHEYHGAWFLDFVVKNTLALRHEALTAAEQSQCFSDLFTSVAKQSFLESGFDVFGPIDNFITKRTSSTLDNMYVQFADWYHFNSASPMKRSDKSKIPAEAIFKHCVILPTDPALTTYDLKLAFGHSAKLIKIRVKETTQFSCSADKLPNGVVIFAKKPAKDLREALPYGGPYPIVGGVGINKIPTEIDVNTDETLYFLVVNNSSVNQSVTINMEPIMAKGGFWKLEGPPKRVFKQNQTTRSTDKIGIVSQEGESVGLFTSDSEWQGNATHYELKGTVSWAPLPPRAQGNSLIKVPMQCAISGDMDASRYQSQSVTGKIFANMLEIRPSHLTVFADSRQPSPAPTVFTVKMPRLFDVSTKIDITISARTPFAGEDSYCYTYRWLPDKRNPAKGM